MTDSPPRWAVATGVALGIAALTLSVFGRGGTVMLIVVALLFAAVAVPLLSMPDRLPDEQPSTRDSESAGR